MLPIPQKPGLGIDINFDALQQFTDPGSALLELKKAYA